MNQYALAQAEYWLEGVAFARRSLAQAMRRGLHVAVNADYWSERMLRASAEYARWKAQI